MAKDNSEKENAGVYGVAAGLSLIFLLIAIVLVFVELSSDFEVF